MKNTTLLKTHVLAKNRSLYKQNGMTAGLTTSTV